MKPFAVYMAAVLLILPGCFLFRKPNPPTGLAPSAPASQAKPAEPAPAPATAEPTAREPLYAPEAADWPVSGILENGIRIIPMAVHEGSFDPATIVVRKGETVRLEMTTDKEGLGIDIWGYPVNQLAKPDQTTIVQFRADKAGQFHFTCPGFGNPERVTMSGQLYVLDPGSPKVPDSTKSDTH